LARALNRRKRIQEGKKRGEGGISIRARTKRGEKLLFRRYKVRMPRNREGRELGGGGKKRKEGKRKKFRKRKKKGKKKLVQVLLEPETKV